MPMVWTNGHIYITVYVRDHQPPHVHVSDSDNEVEVIECANRFDEDFFTSSDDELLEREVLKRSS